MHAAASFADLADRAQAMQSSGRLQTPSSTDTATAMEIDAVDEVRQFRNLHTDIFQVQILLLVPLLDPTLPASILLLFLQVISSF